MKYVALLRGINVGGNNIIRMVELKKAFEECGYSNVTTYINSGNVIFESEEKNTIKITEKLEKALSQTFNYKARLVIRSHEDLKQVVSDVPSSWKKKNDLRCYIAFVKEPVTVEVVMRDIELREDVDSIDLGKHVIYMSTKLSGLTKSKFNKLAAKKIYQDITIRNFNTTQKLLALMEK